MGELEALKDEVNQLHVNLLEARKDAADSDLTSVLRNQSPSVPSLGRVTLHVRRNLQGHLAKIYSIGWAHDSRHLVSASQDGKLIVWDTYTTNKVHAIPLRSSWVMSCSYASSGRFVASGGLDNICSLFDVQSRNGVCTTAAELTGHQGYISGSHFLSNTQIITSSGDKTCILWDIEKTSPLTTFRGHLGDVVGMTTAQDGRTFISGSCDATAKLWDVRSNGSKCTQTFVGHEGDINTVRYFPQQSYAFASGSDDATCRVFDIRADQEVAQYYSTNITFGVTGVAFSRSGRLLFSSYDNYAVVVWDTLQQQKVGELTGHENRVSCLGVPHDGTAVATGSWDSLVKVWSL